MQISERLSDILMAVSYSEVDSDSFKDVLLTVLFKF